MRLINRETYKKIKSMDREELSQYLNNYYNEAYNNGVKSVSTVITEKIVNGLKNTKGIGEKRMTEILANINREFTVQDPSNDKEEI